MSRRTLRVSTESWPIEGRFRLARGAKTHADVVVVEISGGAHVGRGECVPYARYGETMDSVVRAIEETRAYVESDAARAALVSELPAGAARNALDCALWDLEARGVSEPVWRLAGLTEPGPVQTCLTLDLDSPDALEERARAVADRPWLKLKVGDARDLDRLRAVHRAAPSARLIVDANESWTAEQLAARAPELEDLGVALVEQPLPVGEDVALVGLPLPIPVCADESFHTRADLEAMSGRYDAVNVKLDKTGGLTEAIATVAAARAAGLRIMVGCMVSTSLAIAPALLLAAQADWVDLDGALLLARDREAALRSEGSLLYPPTETLWGG